MIDKPLCWNNVPDGFQTSGMPTEIATDGINIFAVQRNSVGMGWRSFGLNTEASCPLDATCSIRELAKVSCEIYSQTISSVPVVEPLTEGKRGMRDDDELLALLTRARTVAERMDSRQGTDFARTLRGMASRLQRGFNDAARCE